MFSRLSAMAAFFAVVTTASLAYAVTVQQHTHTTASVPAQVVMLEPVVITGKHRVN
jgi:hypothetical protein